MKTLHLTNCQNQISGFISLRCAGCKLRHPKSPAALLWWKTLKDKDQLRCPRCGGKNFVRTDSQVPQGVLISEAIDKHSTTLKRVVEDEAGEGAEVEKIWSAKNTAEVEKA